MGFIKLRIIIGKIECSFDAIIFVIVDTICAKIKI